MRAGTPSTRSSFAPTGRERHGLELLPTRYDEVAAAFGGHGEDVSSVDELRPALERSINSKPALVNVMIERAAAPRY